MRTILPYAVGSGWGRWAEPGSRKLALALAPLILLSLFHALEARASYTELGAVIAGGGGAASAGPYSVTDTAIQPCVSSANSASYTLETGFWNDVNSAPTAGVAPSWQLTNASWSISLADLLAYPQNPDGGPLTLVAIDATSALGGMIALSNGWVSYQAPSGFSGTDSFGYAVQDASGDRVACTVKVVKVNAPPVLISSSDPLAYVLLPFTVTNTVTGLNPPLTFGWEPGAPAGMWMNPVNGTLSWTPTRAQARSTNVFRVWVTDSSTPPLGATNTLTVAVDDYAELSLGEATMQVGDSNSVPVTLGTSAGLTNLTALVELPQDRLTSPSLTGWLPGIAEAELLQQGPGTWQITVTAAAGQVLPNAATLARLSFVAISNTTAVVPLNLSGITNLTSNGLSLARNLANTGRVIMVGKESLLEVTPATNGQPSLVLYGQRGASLKIDACADLSAPAGSWQSVWQGTVPNNLRVTLPGPTNSGSAVFFRALQSSGQ